MNTWIVVIFTKGFKTKILTEVLIMSDSNQGYEDFGNGKAPPPNPSDAYLLAQKRAAEAQNQNK